MFTVIWMVIVADRIAAACSMPARKLAGAAMAAASNSRLMVMPPDVSARTVVGPLWALAASTDSLGRVGVGGTTGTRAEAPPPLLAVEGIACVSTWSHAVLSQLSGVSSGSVKNLGLIA